MTRKQRILQACVAQLAEHFDTVQIFATLEKENETLRYDYGQGNFFTIYGQVKLWTEKEEKKEKIK